MRAWALTGAVAVALLTATSATAQVASRPANRSVPRISGRAVQGTILTASHGKWTHDPSAFTYRWQRCTSRGRCTTIEAGPVRLYRLGRVDVGRRLRVIVTAHNGRSSKPVGSKRTSLVKKHSTAVRSTPTGTVSSDGTAATGYLMNAQHTGYSPDDFSTSAEELWSVSLGAQVSYPLIANGQVFVIAAGVSPGDPALYALDASTGDRDWGPVLLGGSSGWAGLTYDTGQVFVENASGTMEAFSASTGTLNWATQLPDQYSFTAPPTAYGGMVYTSGAGDGGTLYAVNESDGALAWSAPVENGDVSSPAVSSTGVYVSYACGQTYDFSPDSGSLNWWRDTACEGGGGSTPVLGDGHVYVIDNSFPAVLDAGTGSVLSSFRSSGPPPAVSPSQVFNLENGVLSAEGATPGSSVDWSFSGDGTLWTTPIVAGDQVIVAGGSGEVYALSASSGQVDWQVDAGAQISQGDGAAAPPVGLATSGGLLVVPAGDDLVAYR